MNPTETRVALAGRQRAASALSSWRRLLIPALLLLLYAAQCIWFIRTQSFVFDEPLHIRAGLEAWRYGRFEQVLDHPPLGHLLPTIFAARGDWNIDLGDPLHGRYVQAITPDPVGLADRTRPVNVVLGVMLGMLLWSMAQRLFSVGAANVALALFAFSPSLIAHFSLITTDGICTLMVFSAAFQLLSWRSNPSQLQTILLGIVLGLLLLAKLSTPPVFCLTVALVLVLKPGRWSWSPRQWNFRAAILAVFVAVVVFWAGYFFHVSRLQIGDGEVILSSPHREPVVKPIASIGHVFSFMRAPLQKRLTLYVPAGEYLEGIALIALHNRSGHKTFLNGKVAQSPTIAFHVAVAFLKSPPLVWLFFFCSILLILLRKLRLPGDFYVMLLYPAFFLIAVSMARITMGERHFLPIYPFILVVASAVWEIASANVRAAQPSPSQGSVWRLLIVAALLLNAADALRYAPDYLSYMNIVVPNRLSYQYLSDSNLDWGQGLLALRKYEYKHPNEIIHLAYFGSTDPKIYGIKALPLEENERVSGTVIVSATHLVGEYLVDPSGYRWVTQYPPKAILNHSLFVFCVPSTSGSSPEGKAKP